MTVCINKTVFEHVLYATNHVNNFHRLSHLILGVLPISF